MKLKKNNIVTALCSLLNSPPHHPHMTLAETRLDFLRHFLSKYWGYIPLQTIYNAVLCVCVENSSFFDPIEHTYLMERNSVTMMPMLWINSSFLCTSFLFVHLCVSEQHLEKPQLIIRMLLLSLMYFYFMLNNYSISFEPCVNCFYTSYHNCSTGVIWWLSRSEQ